MKVSGPKVKVSDWRTTKVAPKKADPELQTEAHKAWRSEVLRRAGFRCEWVEDGIRCQISAPSRLFADHIIERRDGGDPLDVANGQCLCGSHHARKTLMMRAARISESS